MLGFVRGEYVSIWISSAKGLILPIYFGVKIGKAVRYASFFQSSEEFGAQSAFSTYSQYS